jgi:hypothetical protein
MAKVSILHRDGSTDDYSTYSAARTAANSGDLIQIWADLNEQIVLKNLVDIWVAPGVTLDYSSGITVTDNNVSCNCNIYGYGKITNSSINQYTCIYILNSGSKLTINCYFVESEGWGVRIDRSNKFYLTCQRVTSHKSVGIWIGVFSVINDVCLEIERIDTGIEGLNNTGNSALLISGSGYLKIDDIICRNLGHALSPRGGELTATIRKMTTIRKTSSTITTIHIAQGSGTQKLILYFDEIFNLPGSSTLKSWYAVQLSEGTGIFIGRKIFCPNATNTSTGISITGSNTKGYVNVNEVYVENATALSLHDFTNIIIVDINFVSSNKEGLIGAVYSTKSATFILQNSIINNTLQTSPGVGVSLQKISNFNNPNATLRNLKIISQGSIIYHNTSTPAIEVKNYGLIGNKDTDQNIDLKIGDNSNYWFIHSSDLT